MEDSFMVAGIFNESHEAHLFKSKLEASGVEAFIDFDNTGSGGFIEASGTTGVRVKIKHKDLEKARHLVNDFQIENLEYVEHLKGDDILYEGKTYMPWEGYCQKCDHDKVFMKKGSILRTILAIATLGAATIFFFGYRTKLCTNCNHTWKD